MPGAREDYGIDAPTVVGTLATIGGVLVTTGAATVALLHWHVVGRSGLTDALRNIGLVNGSVCLAMAGWMLASSRWLKARVTGIDLWQARDLAGNTPDALRANAAAAGVEGRITVDTGDARSLPYPDAAFDVVTSMTALHNIPDASGRRAAVAEPGA